MKVIAKSCAKKVAKSITQGALLNSFDPATDEDISMLLNARSGGTLVDAKGDSDALILTPVLNITTANGVSVSDSTTFRKTTQSFIIEWYGNIINVVNYWVRCGDGSVVAPGYMLTPAQIRLGNAAGQFCNQNHGLGFNGGGWVHCMIVIDRAGFVDAYKNGVRTMHYDISASAAQSLDTASSFTLVSQIGANGTQAHLSYFRMYEFSEAVPALDFAALALSNFQTGDINSALLTYCTHDFNFTRNTVQQPTLRYYNSISDSDLTIVISGNAPPLVYSEHGSKYELDYGYSIFNIQLLHDREKLVKRLPLLRSGLKKNQFNTSDIILTSAPSTMGAYWITDVLGIESKINLADCRVRFSPAFFDRSNTTIWNNSARLPRRAIITLTGTDGTANLTVNGVTEAITFRSSLTTTADDFIKLAFLPFKVVGVGFNYVNTQIVITSEVGINLAGLTLTNTSGTLSGTILTSGGYDSNDKLAFDIDELNQRCLMSMLNDDYKSMLYVKGQSTYYGSQYSGTCEYLERDNISEVFLSSVDKVGNAHKSALTYTGDIFAAVTDDSNALVYSASNHIQLGFYKSKKAQMMIRLDDGLVSEGDLWKAYFDSVNITAVNISVITNKIDTDGYITWDKARELEAHGWCVYSHGRDVDNFQYQPPALMDAYMSESMQAIIDNGIENTGLICPHNYTILNLRCRYYAIRNYRALFTAWTPNTIELTNDEKIQKDLINSLGSYTGDPLYDITTPEGIANVKAQIDVAVTGKRIVSVFFHAYNLNEATGLTEIINYCIANNVEIVTAKTALDNCKYLLLD